MKWSAILGMLCWGALIISGLLSLETNIEDLSPWLPQATPEREEYDQFLAQFGNDSVLVIAWSDISLGDTRIEEFQQFLLNAAQDDGTNTVGSTSLSGLIKDVIVAEDLIRKLQEKSQSVSREEAIQKLQPFIIGYDGKTTCLLVPLTQEGDRIRRDVVDAVLQISQKIPSIASQLRLGGRPYLGYYSSQVTRRTVVRLSIPVALLSTLLAWL